MRFEILDEANTVVNVIVAEQDFVDAIYPGRYRLVAEAEAVAEPPATPTRTPLTQLQFRLLLTVGERLTVRQIRQANAALDDFLDLMDFASEIDLSNPLTIQGLTYASMLGCFTPERLEMILAGQAP